MTEREALSVEDTLKLALEALQTAEYGDYDKEELNAAITAIKAVLSASDEQRSVSDVEPVAQSRPFTKKQRDTLCTVYAIASASTTANSLPNIAKIVNELLTEDLEVQPKEPEQEKNLLKRVISWMEKVSDSTPENTDDEGIALVKDIYKALAQPEQEPVAFYVYKPTLPRGHLGNVSDGDLPWVYDQDPSSGYSARMLVYTTPYVATPLPPQRPSRSDIKPLTDEQMFKIWLTVPAETDDRFAFARAIEAAHGITDKCQP